MTAIKVTKILSKNKSNSSKKWLQRQLNDQYVHKAKLEGYRSRAAYKLIEINEKYSLIKPNQIIVDLGAAPGGWSQVAASILQGNGEVIAVDLLEMAPIPNVNFIQADFYDVMHTEFLTKKAHVILSDMAPNTTGHAETDHIRIMDLCEQVFDFADKALHLKGSLVMKIFQGGAQTQLLTKIKQRFAIVKHHKPPASRKDSSEMYLVAKGFRI